MPMMREPNFYQLAGVRGSQLLGSCAARLRAMWPLTSLSAGRLSGVYWATIRLLAVG